MRNIIKKIYWNIFWYFKKWLCSIRWLYIRLWRVVRVRAGDFILNITWRNVITATFGTRDDTLSYANLGWQMKSYPDRLIRVSWMGEGLDKTYPITCISRCCSVQTELFPVSCWLKLCSITYLYSSYVHIYSFIHTD